MPVGLSAYSVGTGRVPGGLGGRFLPVDGAEHVQVFVHGLQVVVEVPAYPLERSDARLSEVAGDGG
jgi:hypothetical protein